MIHPGSQLGPYLVDRELGRGGMAFVYHAVDQRSGDEVALKVLAPDDARNPGLLRRFQQEGEIALRLRHPNIVYAYAAGVIEGYHYIALDYAARGTLSTLVAQRREPVALEETVQLLRRVALALDYAHSRDVLHRDVKPSNILLGSTGQVWLADFGIARHLDGKYIMLTAGAQPIGTPSYMSPEQIRHDAEIDGRSDIYSLGVVAYKLLSGGLPFEAKTQVTLLHKIAYEPPTSPQKHNARLRPGTCYALEQVLAKNPDARFTTAAAFIDALADSPHHKPSKAEWEELRRTSAPPPDPDAEPQPVAIDKPGREAKVAPPPPRPSPRVGKRVGWLLALGGLAAVILFALLWTQSTLRPDVADSPRTASPTRQTGNSSIALLITATVTLASEVASIATRGAVLPSITPTEADLVAPATIAAATPAPTLPVEGRAGLKDSAVSDLVSTPTRSTSLSGSIKPPTSTPVPELATDTPTPTNTATPTAIATSTRLATATPIVSVPQAEVAEREEALAISALLLSPGEGESVDSRRTFIWQPLNALPAGYSFEPIFWVSGQDPLADGRGWGGSTMENQLVIDLTRFSEIPSGFYKWGVLLVEVNPYRRIELISEGRTIIIHRPSDSQSDGGNKSPPTPAP